MKDTTIVIIVIIVAGVFLFPSLMAGFDNILDDIGDFLKYGFDNENNGLFGAEGQTGINLKVYYADGTVKELSIFSTPLYPMLLPDGEQGGMERIEADFVATLQYQGTMTNYDSDWTYSLELKDGAGTVKHNFGSWTHAVTGDWKSGEPLTFKASENPMFSKQTVYRSELEQAMQGQPSGNYRLDFSLAITLTADFDDGTTDSINGDSTSYYAFAWELTESKLTSLAIHVDAVPLS